MTSYNVGPPKQIGSRKAVGRLCAARHFRSQGPPLAYENQPSDARQSATAPRCATCAGITAPCLCAMVDD